MEKSVPRGFGHGFPSSLWPAHEERQLRAKLEWLQNWLLFSADIIETPHAHEPARSGEPAFP